MLRKMNTKNHRLLFSVSREGHGFDKPFGYASKYGCTVIGHAVFITAIREES